MRSTMVASTWEDWRVGPDRQAATTATFRMATEIDAPPAVCFDLSRSIDLHIESMLASDERAVGGITSGLIAAGEEVTWEARHFGVRWRMTSRIVAFDPPHHFVDEMVRGPFKAFRHEHRFEPVAAGTRMTDVITFRTPVAVLTQRAIGLYLRRLMRIRNAAIRVKAESVPD